MTASPIAIGNVGENTARIEQSLAVLWEGLGQGYISDERLRWYAAPSGEAHGKASFRSALAATDTASGQVIGVLTSEIVDASALRASFLQHENLLQQDADMRLLQPGATGLIKSIAVAPASQGRGVATGLITRALRDLAEHGAAHSYSLAWSSKQRGCALCGVLTALGFRSVRRIERFWYSDSLANGYLCPACGNPCDCSAQVMIR